MKIQKITPTGKLGKGIFVELSRVAHGSIGISTQKGMNVTLVSRDETQHVTFSAAEFALMRSWFDKHGCEE